MNAENKNVKNILIIFGIMLILFILLTFTASAYQRPEFNDGLGAKWHQAKICLPCHYMLAGTGRASEISNSCDNCHKYKQAISTRKGIDMAKIEAVHVDMVCIACHVGSKSQKNLTAGDFHRVMSKTACLKCHTFENGTYIKPLKRKCSDCHSGSPHVVHGKKLERMCVACHGEFGEQYSNPGTSPEDKMKAPSLSNLTQKTEDISKYPTIGQLIINLLEQLT